MKNIKKMLDRTHTIIYTYNTSKYIIKPTIIVTKRKTI